jgi:replicative DNA helicase
MDKALGGIHGINIMGGTPKAGKSAFFIQIASEMALRKIPVIYYDFENGRQKIYLRILSRLSRLAVDRIRENSLPAVERQRLAQAQQTLHTMLHWLRVVNDRKLSPETMRRHIDFLRHETNADYTVVVIDSLHKLPLKDISQQRSGIDGWLRHLEAIRDELAVGFLVISELERGKDGQFDRQPHLGSFKGSGDIGYSADNAMVLLPEWDPFDDKPPENRHNELWLVASREQSPGRIASYRLDYPYWGFREEE